MQTLVLSLADGQPVLPSVPLSAAQREQHCATGTLQSAVPLQRSAYTLQVSLVNLNTGPCECPVLSVLGSPGVAFQGTVQWGVDGVQSSIID